MFSRYSRELIKEISVTVERSALKKVAPYLIRRGYEYPCLIMDEMTEAAAGEKLAVDLETSGLQPVRCLVEAKGNGDVIADESTLIRTLLCVPRESDGLVAVGAGTIHDITRLIADRMNLPFISVPTAASVDGFASQGAPIILDGVKQTVQTCAPEAIFADTDVLQSAPQAMIAAGIGDMVGKYTSLIDWQISRLIADEPYDVEGAARTSRALERCIQCHQSIVDRTDTGIEILMKSLIESGKVMMQVGHSRPASGAEHHLSHYWEMDFLRKGKPQVLHGEKVGVATVLIAGLYRNLSHVDLLSALSDDDSISEERKIRLQTRWHDIQALWKKIPSPGDIAALLSAVGGPTRPQDIGIDSDLVFHSLHEAHLLRDRYTGLKLAFDLQLLPETTADLASVMI